MGFLKPVMSSLLTWRARLIPGVFLAALMLALSGCGGGGGSGGGNAAANSCTSATCGTVQIALTDADGDFLRYSVGVVSLDLVKADGTIVHVLPATTTQVDFTQLVNFSEVLTAADVPQGAYKQGSITLDYTNADIEVEVAGQAVKATVTDPQGNPLTQETLEIKLDDHRPLVVSPGQMKLLTLDFNLAASNEVDITQSPPVVKVSPFLSADIDRVNQKATRVRGPLVSVDVPGMTYTIDVRPFDCDDQGNDGEFGQMVVQVDANTMFEVNGVPSVGSPGLDALNALPVGTPTIARGQINIDPLTQAHVFLASAVKAGTSVAGRGSDAILGNVVSRSGDTLMVRGATITRQNGQVDFNDNVTVTVGPNTDVRKDRGGIDVVHVQPHHSQNGENGGNGNGNNGDNGNNGNHGDNGNNGNNGNHGDNGNNGDNDDDDGGNGDDDGGGNGTGDVPLDIGDISVGQRVEIHGFLSGSGTQNVTLDATGGRVRLLQTQLSGTVNAVAPGHLTMTLKGIDHRDISIFDFSGTGITTAEDANPANYQVNTGSLVLTQVPGDAVNVTGFVVPFGQATATEDFDALLVENMAGAGQDVLIAGWGPDGTAAPFSSLTNDGIVLDLANPALGAGHSPHFLVTGDIVLDLTTLTGPLTLLPPASGSMGFAIKNGANVQFFTTFPEFVTALTGLIDGTNVVTGVFAEGTYDSSTGNLPAELILVRIGVQ